MTDVLDDVKLDKCKILIVDDIQDNVIMLGAHLKSKGYNVITANNGVKALSLAVQESPDLIMMDINMPQLSGLDACAQLKQNTATRNIPVILVTAHSDVDDIVTGFEVGADDYLIKPYNYMEMQARVRSMLRVRKFQEELLIANKKLDEINHSLEEKVKQQVSELERANKLRRFFSPQIVETIVGDNETMLNEHRREISVVFLDLRNFTSFAEQNDAAKVIQTVNELHSTVGPLIFKHRGTLERFTGDGMMVFLGDPEPIPDHPEKAVEMALDIQAAVDPLYKRWLEQGYDLPLGVSIATGEASLGTIGFEGRVDYAAIGTVTNLSARICSLTPGGQIYIDESTEAKLTNAISRELIGSKDLKGFSQNHRVFKVVR
ncbi:MAG: response regulator [Lentisphaeria bacterium]|nr:response regulator [Lentisphaeria bacterium]